MAIGNGNDANVTIGVVVNQEGLNRVAWPGDYTVHIKQLVDSSGLKNAAFLGDYTQTVTQIVKQDASWRKAFFIGDRVATTTLQLNTRNYDAALASLRVPNNVITADVYMRTKGAQEVAAAYSFLEAIRNNSGVVVDSKFNGGEVLAGLKKMQSECSNLNQVFAYLENLMLKGDGTATNFANALRRAVGASTTLMQLQNSMSNIQQKIGIGGTNTLQWKDLQQFSAQGANAMKANDFGAMLGWQDTYNSKFRGVLSVQEKQASAIAKEQAAQERETSRREQERLRNLEAIENAYKNVSRAIEGVNAKAGQYGIEQRKYKSELDELKKLQRKYDIARRSNDAYIIAAARKSIQEGDAKNAAKKAYGALGFLNTEKKQRLRGEISDAGYAGRIQSLKNQSAALETKISKLAGKGQDITGLQESLRRINEYISGMADTKDPVGRIKAITEALRQLAETRNNANKLSVGASEYKRLERQDEAEQKARLRRIDSLESQLQRAFTSASKKNGETSTMRGWFDQGSAYIERARSMKANEDEYLRAKKDVNEIIRLLDEEARKTQVVAETRKKANAELERAENRITAVNGTISAKEHYADKNTAIASQIEMLRGFNSAMKNAASSADGKYNGRTFKEYLADSKNAENGLNVMVTAYKQLGTQIREAEKELRKYNELQGKGVSNANIEANKRALEALIRTMRDAQATGDATRMMEMRFAGMAGIDQAKSVRMDESARASQKTMETASEAAKNYQAQLDRIAQGHERNISLANQLRQEFITLYSVQQVRQFLASIVEIGGQFEQQRMSIASILSDASKANVLFEQVKGLGLHSNFTTLELDKYVKELSAFDIEYNQLFDKMKKLADISAGTGTDMSRIILAYGHVKAAGYLEGMQRRQFTNANINIIGGLRKLYQEREGRNVSAADIYKRISNKQVSYRDVDKVLMQMAEPGGKFYNMQEVMADTTKGVWKNLGDAWNHMLLAFNEQFGGLIKVVGKGLTSLTRVIGRISPMLIPLLGTWAALTKMRSTYNNVTGQGVAQSIKDIRIANKQRLVELEKIRYLRELTEAEFEEYQMRKKGAFAANVMYGKEGTREATDKALVGIHTGKLKASEAKQFVEAEGISREHAIILNRGMKDVLDGKRFATAKYAWYGFANTIDTGMKTAWATIKGFTASIRSMFASMLPMLAIEGMIAGISYAFHKAGEDAKKSAEAMNMVSDAVRNLSETLSEYKDITKKEQMNTMSREELMEMEKSLLETAKNELGGSVQSILSGIYQTDNKGHFLKPQIDRAWELKQALEKARNELEKIRGIDYNSGIEKAFQSWNMKSAKGDAFGHDMAGQIVLYSESVAGVRKAMVNMKKEEKDSMRVMIKNASVGVKGMDAFRNSAGELNDKLAEQYMYLVKLGKIKLGDGTSLKNDKGVALKGQKGINAGNIMLLENYASRVEAMTALEEDIRKHYGDDIAKATPTQFREMARNYIIKFKPEISPKDAADAIDFITSKKYGLTVAPEIEDPLEKIENDESWKSALKEYFGNNQLFAAVIEASPNLASAQEACQKLYDELWMNWEKLKMAGKAFDLDINVNLNSGNAASTKADIEKRLQDLYGKRSNFNINSMFSSNEQAAQKAQTEFNKINGQIEVLEEMLAIADAMFQATSARSSGFLGKPKGEKNPKKNKERTRKDTRDKGLKNWDSRLDAIDALQDTFEKAYEDYGESVVDYLAIDEDWQKALEDVKKLRGYNADYDLMSLENGFYKWKKDIYKEEIPNEGGELDKDAREKAKDELLKDIKDFERNREKDERERALKEVDRYIESTKGRIDMYYRILDTMYDTDISKQFAFEKFIPDFDLEDLYIYEEMPRIIADFNRKMEKEVNAIGDKKYTYDMLTGRESLAGVPMRIVEEFLEAQKQIEEVANNQKEKIVEIIGNYRTAYDQLENDRKKFDRDMKMIDLAQTKGWLSEGAANAMRDRMNAMNNKKELEASYDYYKFFLESNGIFDETLDIIGNKIKDNLADQMHNGVIEAKEYFEQVKKVDDVLKKNQDSKRRNRFIYDMFGINGTRAERNQKALDEARKRGDEAENAIRESNWYKGLEDWDRNVIDDLIKTHNLRPWEVNNGGDENLANALNSFYHNREIQDKREDKRVKYDKLEDAAKVINKVNDSIKSLQECFGAFKEMMDALGYDMETKTALGLEAGMNALVGFGDSVTKAMSGDYFGAAVSGLTTMFKFVNEYAQIHDKMLDKEIEKIRGIVSMLESVKEVTEKDISKGWGVKGQSRYTTRLYAYYGDALYKSREEEAKWDELYNSHKNSFSAGTYKKNRNSWKNAREAIREAMNVIKIGSAYDTEYNEMQASLAKKIEERSNILSKDRVDIDEIKSVTQEIINLQEEIDTRAEEHAKDVFGIDFKQWSQTLTDAMIEAFTNGEDAALKWQSTVDQIVRDVSKNIANKMITEAIIEPIYEKYMGYDAVSGKHGLWRGENGSFLFDEVTSNGAQNLHSDLSAAYAAAEPALRELINATNALTWTADANTGGSLTKIGQSLTEETGSIMAGYINGINGNVSAMRTIADSQLKQLDNIAQHTLAIANNTAKLSILEDVVNGTKAFAMK